MWCVGGTEAHQCLDTLTTNLSLPVSPTLPKGTADMLADQLSGGLSLFKGRQKGCHVVKLEVSYAHRHHGTSAKEQISALCCKEKEKV